jgi:hypothetical protein
VSLHAFDPARPLNIPWRGALTARALNGVDKQPRAPVGGPQQYDYHRCLPACVLHWCTVVHPSHSAAGIDVQKARGTKARTKARFLGPARARSGPF